MRVLITSILILLSALSGICQSIEGMWIQEYSVYIESNDSIPVFDEQNFDSVYWEVYDTPKLDTTYYSAANPIYFTKELHVYSLKDTGVYTILNDTIFIDFNKRATTEKMVMDGEEGVIIFQAQAKKRQYGPMVRFDRSQIFSEAQINRFYNELEGTVWEVLDASNEVEFSLDFVEGKNLALTRIKEKQTNRATYHV